MAMSETHEETRRMVQLAAAICEEKKGGDTRILELDPIDSGLSDFFLITSATNDRQATAIADEIELRLKREFGVYAQAVEGRRAGEWILLDYFDFVVHVFLAERRAFYDIERLRKSAKPFTPAEFDADLKAALAAETLAARNKSAKKVAVAKPKAAAKKAVTAVPVKSVKAAVPPAAEKAVAAPKIAKKKSGSAKVVVTKKAVGKKPVAAAKAIEKMVIAPKPAKKATPKTVVTKKLVFAKATPAKKAGVASKGTKKQAIAPKAAKKTSGKAAPKKKWALSRGVATKKAVARRAIAKRKFKGK